MRNPSAEMQQSRFALDIRAFAEKAGANVDTVIRKVATDMLGRIVYRTPVGNPSLWQHKAPPGYVGGRLRGNWTVSIGTRTGIVAQDAIDPSGRTTIEKGTAVLVGYRSGPSIHITNSLPYARPVEYGHSSIQAPAGMVRLTVSEFQKFVNEAARSVNR